jgi:hypothetical protein
MPPTDLNVLISHVSILRENGDTYSCLNCKITNHPSNETSNFMEQIYSGKAKVPNSSPSPYILQNPKVGYHAHESPSLFPANFKVILSW